MVHHDEFYSSISPWYDDIFPYKPVQYEFVSWYLPGDKTSVILDIGCATGSLANRLAGDGHAVYGVDSDEEMIRQAIRKKESQGFDQFPVFRQLDMAGIDQAMENHRLDAVTCFGNTLVHLKDSYAIERLIDAVFRLLGENRHFLFQILHYDHILEQRIQQLPIIENDTIRFERRYEYNDHELLDFVTRLVVKEDGRQVENRISLYPLRKDQLATMLKNAGFREIHFYSSFKKDALHPDSMPLVVEALK